MFLVYNCNYYTSTDVMKIGSQTLSMLQQKIVKCSVHLKSVASFPYWLQRNCKVEEIKNLKIHTLQFTTTSRGYGANKRKVGILPKGAVQCLTREHGYRTSWSPI